VTFESAGAVFVCNEKSSVGQRNKRLPRMDASIYVRYCIEVTVCFFQLGKHVESALKLKPGSYKKTS